MKDEKKKKKTRKRKVAVRDLPATAKQAKGIKGGDDRDGGGIAGGALARRR
jgi:hypothetical protein